MAQVLANGIQIEYEISGPKDGPVVLLVMGLAAQLTQWPVDFVSQLNDAGYRTIAFDNRDIGLSEKMEKKRAPNPVSQIVLRRLGVRGLAPYRLHDMAKDAIGLLDALSIEKAHIVGVSMGGLISQIIAGEYPERTLSLTAIMTTTNNKKLPRPKSDAAKLLFKAPKGPLSRKDAIDRKVWGWGIIGTKDSGSTPEEVRARMEAAYDRSNYPIGPKRQLSAIIETGDVRRYSRRVKVPTLVIHGRADPLVPVEGGMNVAHCIPHADLHIIEDMGHDLPKKHLAKISALMIETYKTIESSQRAA
ncbi:MAG: alpha/beta fold hydrolase [Alphaproteobacteria bacterium]